MIDPHTHLRDFKERSKETIENSFKTAVENDVKALFEMPNTQPPLIDEETILERIKLADKYKDYGIFHGIYVGLTNNQDQIREAVWLYKKYFPRVIGIKMYCGHSTGNMGIIDESLQDMVYKILSEEEFTGVLTLHCEKESFIDNSIFDIKNPYTHCIARPKIAEIESIKDQIAFAKKNKFKGIMHIAHLSVYESLLTIESEREKLSFKITTAVTPHHIMYDETYMRGDEGIFYKVNPPLRDRENNCLLLDAIKEERIDYIESDHAPHTREDKLKGASGMPSLREYKKFINYLKEKGVKKSTIAKMTFLNIRENFKLNL